MTLIEVMRLFEPHWRNRMVGIRRRAWEAKFYVVPVVEPRTTLLPTQDQLYRGNGITESELLFPYQPSLMDHAASDWEIVRRG